MVLYDITTRSIIKSSALLSATMEKTKTKTENKLSEFDKRANHFDEGRVRIMNLVKEVIEQ